MSQIHCLTCQCEARTVADRLRAWRWRKVAATGRPAFVFLYDSELQNLSAIKPKNLIEVQAIMAPQRHLWADELLALLHPEHHTLPGFAAGDPPAERGAPSPATNVPGTSGAATSPGSSGAGSDPEDPGPLGEDEWDPWPADWVPPPTPQPYLATTPWIDPLLDKPTLGSFGLETPPSSQGPGTATCPPDACGAGESGAGDGSDEV